MSDKLKTIPDIEAAYKRGLGNAQKMRETLVGMYNILEKIRSFTPRLNDVSLMREFSSKVCRARRIIDTALSSPPRNCDVGTAEEQLERFMAFCKNYPRCSKCPCCGIGRCEFVWGQMPYTKPEDASTGQEEGK